MHRNWSPNNSINSLRLIHVSFKNIFVLTWRFNYDCIAHKIQKKLSQLHVKFTYQDQLQQLVIVLLIINVIDYSISISIRSSNHFILLYDRDHKCICTINFFRHTYSNYLRKQTCVCVIFIFFSDFKCVNMYNFIWRNKCYKYQHSITTKWIKINILFNCGLQFGILLFYTCPTAGKIIACDIILY